MLRRLQYLLILVLAMQVSCMNPNAAGEWHWGLRDAVLIYAEGTAQTGYFVYAILTPVVKGGKDNLTMTPRLAVSSREDERTWWMEATREKGHVMKYLGGSAYCTFVGSIDPAREYRFVVMTGIRKPKLIDPRAKSLDIDEEKLLQDAKPLPEERAALRKLCLDTVEKR